MKASLLSHYFAFIIFFFGYIKFQQFVLNVAWQVVAGEESEETEVQNQREMRVLEAVYPRPSAIPPKSDIFVPL